MTVEALAQLAARDAQVGGISTTAAMLEQIVRQGNAVVLLDGLDEVRVGRVEFLDRLRLLLDHLGASIDVLVTSRESGATSSTALGLPRWDVQAPRNPLRLVDALLAEAAATYGHSEDWCDERSHTVAERLESTPGLKAVPLFVALLTLLAAEQSVLPATEAELLSEITGDLLQRWERERRGGLPIELAAWRGRAAFVGVGRLVDELGADVVLDGSAQLSRVLISLQSGLLAHGANVITAEAGAEDALEFLLDVGLLIEAEGAIEFAHRSFADAAAARRIAAAESGQRQTWIGALLERDADLACLPMAIDVNPDVRIDIAEALSERAAITETCEQARRATDGRVLDADSSNVLEPQFTAALGDSDTRRRNRAVLALSRIRMHRSVQELLAGASVRRF